MILVIGATGTSGRALLDRLGDLGVAARALVRPGRAGPGPDLPDGTERVTGDAGDARALAAALDGVTQVFLAMGNGPRQEAVELGVVRDSARAGVRHLVKVSAPVVGATVPVAVARIHHTVERAVVDAGIGHTFLRPYAFMQNLVNHAPLIRRAGFFAGITGDTPLNLVDARDVGAVAAVALTTGRTAGRALVLTGAEAVSQPEIARRLSALGRPTRFLDQRAGEYRADLRRAGSPPWLVDHLVEIQELAMARAETPNGTVEELTGRAPRGLDDFLRETLHQFRSAGPPPDARGAVLLGASR